MTHTLFGKRHRKIIGCFLVASWCVLSTSCTSPTSSPTESPIVGTTAPLSTYPHPRAHRDAPPRSRPLLPLFEALRDLENGTSSGPITILHLGDSHTAGDRFSGRLRALFQERFGSAGRGSLAPGKPYNGFRPTQVAIKTTPGWKITSSFDSSATGIFGLSGFRLRSSSHDDWMQLKSTSGFNLVEVEVMLQPNGGTFRLTVDEHSQGVFTTIADTPQIGLLRLPVSEDSHDLELRPIGGGPVELLSWATLRENQPGIIYESHGMVGATVNIIDRWDPAVTSREIAHLAPVLIVVAYGTNEGFNNSLSAEQYSLDFEARLDLLRRAAPNAAILVVGAPDAERLSPKCYKAAKSPSELPCGNNRPNKTLPVAKSSKLSRFVSNCRWSVPPNLSMTRTVQKRISEQQGYFFWDWSLVMNGACGMHEWVNQTPPLGRADHVHMQTEGYALSAEALFTDIMTLYDAILFDSNGPNGPPIQQ